MYLKDELLKIKDNDYKLKELFAEMDLETILNKLNEEIEKEQHMETLNLMLILAEQYRWEITTLQLKNEYSNLFHNLKFALYRLMKNKLKGFYRQAQSNNAGNLFLEVFRDELVVEFSYNPLYKIFKLLKNNDLQNFWDLVKEDVYGNYFMYLLFMPDEEHKPGEDYLLELIEEKKDSIISAASFYHLLERNRYNIDNIRKKILEKINSDLILELLYQYIFAHKKPEHIEHKSFLDILYNFEDKLIINKYKEMKLNSERQIMLTRLLFCYVNEESQDSLMDEMIKKLLDFIRRNDYFELEFAEELYHTFPELSKKSDFFDNLKGYTKELYITEFDWVSRYKIYLRDIQKYNFIKRILKVYRVDD